ncbi:MAG: YqhA family protein [bacterium]
MLEKILLQSRKLTYIAVVLILFCAIALYLLTTIAALIAIINAAMSDGWDVYSINIIAASFLKIVDFFLLSIGLHLIALGVYKLFINEDIALPKAMGSGSFNELKLTLIKLATIVLLLDFVEQALSSRPPRELMEFGIAIAVVLAAVSWGASQLNSQKSKTE